MPPIRWIVHCPPSLHHCSGSCTLSIVKVVQLHAGAIMRYRRVTESYKNNGAPRSIRFRESLGSLPFGNQYCFSTVLGWFARRTGGGRMPGESHGVPCCGPLGNGAVVAKVPGQRGGRQVVADDGVLSEIRLGLCRWNSTPSAFL